MILKDIQTYLSEHGKASLTELSIRFATDVHALRPMLKRLVRKGRVHQWKPERCQGCTCCSSESVEFYEWVG